jgi:hypothetical protein
VFATKQKAVIPKTKLRNGLIVRIVALLGIFKQSSTQLNESCMTMGEID